MNKIIIPTLFFILCLTSITNGQSTSQSLSSTIKSVKIHLQGAEIHREISANLPVGTSEIIFTDLSPKVKPQSIRVSASSGVTMLSISNRVNFLRPGEESETIKKLRADLKQEQATLESLNNQIAGYQAEQKLLESNQKLTNESRNLSMNEILVAADLFRNRVTMIKQEISKIQREIPDFKEKINQLNNQLNGLSANKHPTSEVYVTVKSTTLQTANFTLEYVVGDAGWAPTYDLFAGELSAPIQLKYRALAYNNSGNDWSNVPIILSTADPLRSADQPDLRPWQLRENAQANIIKGQGRLNYQQEQLYGYLNGDKESNIYNKNEKLKVEFETIEVADVNTEFEVSEVYTIPSDSKPYSIDITSHDLAANYQHYAVPKMEKDAYLLAQITGWEKLQLITGHMNIYRNNSYIGGAKLDTRNFTDTLDLSLGRDPNVLVKRVKKEELSEKQFLGSNKKWTAVYDLTIKNNHNVPIKIEVVDQVPISTNKDINVDVQQISNAVYNESTGKLSWNFNLEPSNIKELRVGFSVKYPKNQEIKLKQTREMQSPRFY